MSKPTTPPPAPIDWAARKARAVAFIRQELKKGHAWAEKTYEYKKEAQ
jgi:hypothetical protein